MSGAEFLGEMCVKWMHKLNGAEPDLSFSWRAGCTSGNTQRAVSRGGSCAWSLLSCSEQTLTIKWFCGGQQLTVEIGVIRNCSWGLKRLVEVAGVTRG